MTLSDILQNEAQSGFANLRGTGIGGTLVLSAAGLNEAVTKALPGLRVEIHASNQVVVRYGPFDATLILARAVDVGPAPPKITMTLTSQAKAWLLKQRTWPPFVHLEGTVITVDLADMPDLIEYQHLWQHITRVNVSTSPGQLQIEFHLAIA